MNPKILNIIGINFDISWKNKKENFSKIENFLQNLEADLLVLPEMFSTGFCMDTAEIADKNMETLNWMKEISQAKNIAICGSVAVEDQGKYYNRMYFVHPDGSYQYYDKKHLFSYSDENKFYSVGNKRVIVNFKGFRILLQICYDLRFPVFSSNQMDYDAIIYTANWPSSRIEAWHSLLKARAIENQAFVFGLNRVGKDGNGLFYPKSSNAYFADGSIISENKDQIIKANFNLEELQNFRKEFAFLFDRDTFELI